MSARVERVGVVGLGPNGERGRVRSAFGRPLRRYAGAVIVVLLLALPVLVSGDVVRGHARSSWQRASGVSATADADTLRLPGTVGPDRVPAVTRVNGSLPEPPSPATLFVATAPPGPLTVPKTVLDAYHLAAETQATDDAGCHLGWALLAAIGRVESNHARGGYVDDTGDTREPILGPVLDGHGDTAAVPDTDNGALDGNTEWDRAVGPMQFIPATWRRYGADANDDGTADPDNVYDAALTAGRYLCSGRVDLREPEQRRAAVFGYNHSARYVDVVLEWAEAYRNGTRPAPDSDVPLAVPSQRVRSPRVDSVASEPGAGSPTESSDGTVTRASADRATTTHRSSGRSTPSSAATSTTSPTRTATPTTSTTSTTPVTTTHSTTRSTGSPSPTTSTTSTSGTPDQGGCTTSSPTTTTSTSSTTSTPAATSPSADVSNSPSADPTSTVTPASPTSTDSRDRC